MLIAPAWSTAGRGPATQLFIANHRQYCPQVFVVSDGALVDLANPSKVRQASSSGSTAGHRASRKRSRICRSRPWPASLGSKIKITLSYCSVRAWERRRSSFQENTSSRTSPARTALNARPKSASPGQPAYLLSQPRHGRQTAPAARRYWNRGRQRYCRSLVRYCSTMRVSADRAANRAAHTHAKPAVLDLQRPGLCETRTLRWRERVPMAQRRGGARRQARSAETGIARCMGPTGGNISVGLNSSTAASMRRWLDEYRSGSGKAEHGPLLVPGKR